MPGRYLGNSRYHIFRPSAADYSHNGTSGKQGGAAGEFYHLTQAQHTLLTSGAIYSASPLIGLGTQGASGTHFEVDYGAHSVKAQVDGSQVLSLEKDAYTLSQYSTARAAMLDVITIQDNPEKLNIGNPSAGIYLQYLYDSDPAFFAYSGTTQLFILTPQTQQLGNASAGGVIFTTDQINGGGGQLGIGTNGGGNFNVLQAQTSPQWVRVGDPSGVNIQLNTTDDDFEIQTATQKVQMNIDTDGMQLNSGARVNTIETTLTDDDTHLPSSGAVYAFAAPSAHTHSQLDSAGACRMHNTGYDTYLDFSVSYGDWYITNTHTDPQYEIHIRGYDGATLKVMARFRPDQGARFSYDGTIEGETVSGAWKATNGFQIGSSNIMTGIQTTITDTDTQMPTSGAVLDAIAAATPDKISEGNSYVEVVDAGTGLISVVADGFTIATFGSQYGVRVGGTDGNFGRLVHDAGALYMTNQFTNGDIILNGFKTGPTVSQMARFRPDGGVDLGYNGTVEAETVSGALKATNALQIGSSGLMTIETTITDDDTKLPSSGAVVDYVAAEVPVNITSGTGSPEGVVTGNPGDLFFDTTGGANLTLYVKETGTGNTGWAAK